MDTVGSTSWIYRRSIQIQSRLAFLVSMDSSPIWFPVQFRVPGTGELLVTPGIIHAGSIGKVSYGATIPWTRTQELLFLLGYFCPTWAADGWKRSEARDRDRSALIHSVPGSPRSAA